MRNVGGSFVICVVAGLACVSVASNAAAAPFVLVKMRTLDDSAIVDPGIGDIVAFKITVELNAIDTVNTSSTPARTITSRVDGKDGIASCRFNIQQSLGAPIQLNFSTLTLRNDYNGGLNASGGTLVDRGNGYYDLNSVKAVLAIGTAPKGANAPIVIATGTFQVMEGLIGRWTQIRMTYLGPNQSPGAFRYNDGVGVVAATTDSDPYFAFDGLEFVPEPASAVLLAIGGSALLRGRRRSAG